jgi:hypothetical protein
MAREGVRAYAASDSDHSGRVVSEQAILLIAQNLGLKSSEINTIDVNYECSRLPCLSANSRIRLTISYIDANSHRNIKASAQENISPWK